MLSAASPPPLRTRAPQTTKPYPSTMDGSYGNDIIRGGSDADTIFGSEGDDTVGSRRARGSVLHCRAGTAHGSCEQQRASSGEHGR